MKSGSHPLFNGGCRALPPSSARRIKRLSFALTYLDTLRVEERLYASALVRGQGWRRVLFDHSSFGDMAAGNHILDATFVNFGHRPTSLARPFGSCFDGYFVRSGHRSRKLGSSIYDEGVAHAEVPTSSVRVC